MTGWSAIRSGLFHLTFLTTIAAYSLLLPAALLPRRWGAPIFFSLTRTLLWELKTICGLSFEVRGLKNIPEGPALIASKHQSAWETLAFLDILNDPVFVIKRELAWLPIAGWVMMKMGYIAVSRAAGTASIVHLLEVAAKRAQQGRSIIIFPEGTRTAPMTEAVYLPGVAALYGTLCVPCVPVGLNSGLFWPRRSWRRRPGRIIVEFLEPIPPGLGKTAFMKTLKERIEPAAQRLAQEAIGRPA